MKVRVPDLRKLNMCSYDVARFAAEWPDGAEVTEANILRAFELGLDVNWWAEQVLGLEYCYQRQLLWHVHNYYLRFCKPRPPLREYWHNMAVLICKLLERG